MASLILALPISLASAQLTTTSSSSGSANDLLTLVVYPDGSVEASFSGVVSAPAQPGTAPTSLVEGSVTNSAGGITLNVNGSATVPASLMDQAPFNFSESFTASGNYSGGVSQGTIVVHAVSGVSSPLSSFGLSYHGTATDLTVTGSATLQYGTYDIGGIQEQINETNVSELVSGATSAFNVAYLNGYVGLLPYANLLVTSATLEPQYGASSATISADFAMSGNITALPASLEAYAFCSSGSVSTAQCQSDFNQLYQSFSTLQSYSYQVGYASGVLGFTAASTTNNEASIQDFLNGEASLGGSSTLTASQEAFLNSTTVSLNGLYFKATESQGANGVATTHYEAGGLTIRPTVAISSNSFYESGLFDFLSGGSGNVTIVGGATSAGAVSIQIPSTVPTPASTTSDSATWINVDLAELAPLQFTIGSSTSISYAASSVAVVGGGVSADSTAETGVSVQVSGLTGLNGSVTVITQQLSGPSQGEQAPSGGSPQYFDVFLAPPPGAGFPSGATARVCVQDSGATSATTMVYWSGSAWVSASDVTVAGSTVCGDIPAGALTGTNLATVTPASGSGSTTGAGSSTTSSKTSSGGGIPAFPYSVAGVTVVTVVLVGAYLLQRRRRLLLPDSPA